MKLTPTMVPGQNAAHNMACALLSILVFYGLLSTSLIPECSAEQLTVWHQSGEEKVPKGDRWGNKTNLIWDGKTIKLSAARNEVVSFASVLEATSEENGLSFSLSSLDDDAGHKITTVPKSGLLATAGTALFNYVGRNIEHFYVRYLEIEGLSIMAYEGEYYDERHVPKRFQRPHNDGVAEPGTGWRDRPDHNKLYPEIAVPLELHSPFKIPARESQMIWTDIYIPKGTPPGNYRGRLEVRKAGQALHIATVALQVLPFELPDIPSAKAMTFIGTADLNTRFFGPQASPKEESARKVRDEYFKMLHRHKIDAIDENPGADVSARARPAAEWIPRLNGRLYNANRGYAGPGEGVGNLVYSIGTYGQWPNSDCAKISDYITEYENWFTTNSPRTEHFLYLTDEPTSAQFPKIKEWLACINGRIKTFMTVDLITALREFPTLDISGTWFTMGERTLWENAYRSARKLGKQQIFYNSRRPASGSFAIEDDGVALRELTWAQNKLGIERWFFWSANYYNNYQGGTGQTDLFTSAFTFGSKNGTAEQRERRGETGWNYSNGDGVLLYPGTDKIFKASSYNLAGPFASLRLKYWRRGIQDADYLALASAIDPAATKAVTDRMVPKALWEYGVGSSRDPTWLKTEISWSTNPDDWEEARRDLIKIILSKSSAPKA